MVILAEYIYESTFCFPTFKLLFSLTLTLFQLLLRHDYEYYESSMHLIILHNIINQCYNDRKDVFILKIT